MKPSQRAIEKLSQQSPQMRLAAALWWTTLPSLAQQYAGQGICSIAQA
ncbi:hypothetical protein ABIB42_002257 [Massilia sp. UYP32]